MVPKELRQDSFNVITASFRYATDSLIVFAHVGDNKFESGILAFSSVTARMDRHFHALIFQQYA